MLSTLLLKFQFFFLNPYSFRNSVIFVGANKKFSIQFSSHREEASARGTINFRRFPSPDDFTLFLPPRQISWIGAVKSFPPFRCDLWFYCREFLLLVYMHFSPEKFLKHFPGHFFSLFNSLWCENEVFSTPISSSHQLFKSLFTKAKFFRNSFHWKEKWNRFLRPIRKDYFIFQQLCVHGVSLTASICYRDIPFDSLS